MPILITDLKDHIALVTGASGGIGKATCLALASMGCTIAVHYHSSTAVAEGLVKELRTKGVKAEAFKADLTKYDEVGGHNILNCKLDRAKYKYLRACPMLKDSRTTAWRSY